MEAIRVLISQRGVHKLQDEWEEENHNGERPDGYRVDDWSRGASHWPKGWLNNLWPAPMEVFLSLDSDMLRLGYDEEFVREVVEQVQRSMWGAKAYVVLDNDTQLPFHLLSDRKNVEGFHTWVEELLRIGVSDVLQWPQGKKDGLTDAAARSEGRMRGLVTDMPVRDWKCYAYERPRFTLPLSDGQGAFLKPYLVHLVRELGDANCVLILQTPTEDARALGNVKGLIQRIIDQRPGRRLIVAVIDEDMRQSPTAALQALCATIRGCSLVRFHGVVELYFFLRSLSRFNRDEPTPVPVVEKATFRSHAPRLLITHSYQPGDPRGCLAAARDAWELVRDLSGRVKVTIYPAVKCLMLPRVLKDLGDVLVWVHIGHGDDARGLQQANDPNFKAADDWLKCFTGYGSSLALAVFSSCYSAPVARRFAESGVGVSIGFTRRVHKEFSREVTARVVGAALDSNGSRADILEAFDEGRQLLSIEDKEAMPVAFWARH